MIVEIPCICPGTPHKGDTVTLRDKLDFRTAMTIRNEAALTSATRGDRPLAEIMADLSESYLNHCIDAWTLVDESGTPIPVTRDSVAAHLLSNISVALTVGDAADDLYSEAVLLPLLRKASSSSPATPTNGSTSPPTTGATDPPKRSKRSSISTIPTAATETTSSSLDGDSRLSPSSASAA